jgi:hypothetical protein
VSVTDEEEDASCFSGVLVRDETEMLRARSAEGADATKNSLHSLYHTHELEDACKDDALSSACTPETMILSYHGSPTYDDVTLCMMM